MINDKVYDFNKHGVCTNPDVLYRDDSTKVFIEIEVACCDKGFDHGVDFQTPYSGHGHAPSKNRCFPTLKECIQDVFVQVNGLLISTLNDTNSCKPDYLNKELDKAVKNFNRFMKILCNQYQYDAYTYLERRSRVEVQTSLFA